MSSHGLADVFILFSEKERKEKNKIEERKEKRKELRKKGKTKKEAVRSLCFQSSIASFFSLHSLSLYMSDGDGGGRGHVLSRLGGRFYTF